MSEPTCSIPGCTTPAKAKGWCRKHLSRYYRHGDPLYGENQIAPGTAGIYSITCLANGWVYIGSSQSIRQRWSTHKSWLRNGKHNIPQLQADYDAFGPEALIFEVVSIATDPDERLDCEQVHITAAITTGKCYNLSPGARDNTGHRFTAEQSRRVSEALAGKPKSEEHRANLWQNREVTPEFRERMAANGRALRGKPKSPEHGAAIGRAQRGAANHQAKVSEETVVSVRNRIAAGETGRAIARELGISETAVSQIKTGARWAHVPWSDEDPGQQELFAG